jgi:hypothetical protein
MVNAVISKRFASRQQMQWTKPGAHLLLQTRTHTLNGTLRPLFEQWNPRLANDNAAGMSRRPQHDHSHIVTLSRHHGLADRRALQQLVESQAGHQERHRVNRGPVRPRAIRADFQRTLSETKADLARR